MFFLIEAVIRKPVTGKIREVGCAGGIAVHCFLDGIGYLQRRQSDYHQGLVSHAVIRQHALRE